MTSPTYDVVRRMPFEIHRRSVGPYLTQRRRANIHFCESISGSQSIMKFITPLMKNEGEGRKLKKARCVEANKSYNVVSQI